jgi:FkbM family methyltransferase
MKKIIKVWHHLISYSLGINEKIFFYSKLRKFYLSNDIKNPIIFDIGANKGQSIDFFRGVFKKSLIYAFEPSSEIFKKLNKYKEDRNIIRCNYGLSSKDGTKKFYECIHDEVSSFEKPNIKSQYFKFKSKILLKNPKEMFFESSVTVKKIDDVIEKYKIKKIDICKIDVEGHEVEVLIGAKKTLQKKIIKLFQIEVHKDDQYKISGEDIDKLLKKYSYSKIYEFKHGHGNFFDVIYSIK